VASAKPNHKRLAHAALGSENTYSPRRRRRGPNVQRGKTRSRMICAKLITTTRRLAARHHVGASVGDDSSERVVLRQWTGFCRATIS
jgi:hypothetical protein